jgi:hypothetical protein
VGLPATSLAVTLAALALNSDMPAVDMIAKMAPAETFSASRRALSERKLP